MRNKSGDTWLFFSGIIISCIGESILIGSIVFSYGQIQSTAFLIGIVLLVTGNMLLVKVRLVNLPISKTMP